MIPPVAFGLIAIVAIVVIVGVLGSASKTADNQAGADGVVRGDPHQLAARAGAGIDVYALARMLTSEAGNRSDAILIAIAWTAVNEARRRKTTVSQMLLRGVRKDGQPSSSHGKFGAQYTGKYATTALEASPRALEIARKVMGKLIDDPTKGATQFDSPRSQLPGVAGNTKTAEQVAQARLKQNDLVIVAGIDPQVFRFWRPKGTA